MNKESAEQLLEEICFGRQELLKMGRKFNDQVESLGPPNVVSDCDDTVEAIFELEGVPLSPEEKELLKKLDALKWKDSHVIEFLKVMGRDNHAT